MSSTTLPPPGLTAYQRWELDSFDGPRSPRGNKANSGEERAAALPSVQDIERIHQQAHQEGYAAGYREGAARAAEEAEVLQQLVQTLGPQARSFDASMADELLDLALAISRQVLQQQIRLKPDSVLAVVGELLSQTALSPQRAYLVLNPLDAALVRERLGERLRQAGCDLVEDAQISRGGCRLESADYEVDATLERRWQRVVSALDEEHAHWIE